MKTAEEIISKYKVYDPFDALEIILNKEGALRAMREAAENALKQAATMNHNGTMVTDAFIETYLQIHDPIK